MLKIVGFLDSKPRLCIADFSYLELEIGVPGVNFAGGLGVEQVEGLLEFLDFVFGEAGSLDFLSLRLVSSFGSSHVRF